MSYPDKPTIHESINQFFNFVKEYKECEEDFDLSIDNLDGAEEGEKHPYFQKLEAFETVKTFLEEAYEIAFGDEAINRDFSPEEVIKELQSFSAKAFKYDNDSMAAAILLKKAITVPHNEEYD
jgi:hypothetical protein